MAKRQFSEEEALARKRESKRRWREKNIEVAREIERNCATRKRREKGIAVWGSPEHVEKMKRWQRSHGQDHPDWKGENITYGPLHSWVVRHKEKTGVCSHCSERPVTKRRFGTEWANISGEYRRDLNDYIELCKRCHWQYDKKGQVVQEVESI